MGSWTKEHYQAMDYWAKRNGLKIAMGSHPTARFIDKDGKEKTYQIGELVREYTTQKAEEKKEHRRLKQEEERNKQWARRYS